MQSLSANILGHTGFIHEDGFIDKDKLEVALFALITPAVIEAGCFLWEGRYRHIPRLNDCREWVKIEVTPKKIAAAAAVSLAVAGVAVGIYYGVSHHFFKDIVEKIDFPKIGDETQISPVIFPAYILMAVSHIACMAYSAKQGHALRTVKHAAGTYFGVGAPIAMLKQRYEIRWHHMSYGLLCMLPPLRAVNFFGFLMALDSNLYWYQPHRDMYDFSNIFVKYLPWFLMQMTLLSIWQVASERIFRERSGHSYHTISQDDLVSLDL